MNTNEFNEYKDILISLRSIKAEGPRNYAAGICDNLMGILYPYENFQILDTLETIFSLWPKFSGDLLYPIYSPELPYDPLDQFCNYTNAETGWTKDHPYGALRLELLDFLIQELEKKCQELKKDSLEDQ